MVLDIGPSRLLLESTGWLVAHRKNLAWHKRNPVHVHLSSLSGKVACLPPLSGGEQEWEAWGLVLFRKPDLAVDEVAE